MKKEDTYHQIFFWDLNRKLALVALATLVIGFSGFCQTKLSKTSVNAGGVLATGSSYKTQVSIGIPVVGRIGATLKSQIGFHTVENSLPSDIEIKAPFTEPVNFAENQTEGTVVTRFQAVDPDPSDHQFTYSLVAGPGDTNNSSFTIDGDQLKSNVVFDYEIKNSYSLRLRTADNDGGSYEEAFTINITDVNDFPTDLSISGTTIDEKLPGGTVVGNLSTTDQDIADTHIYSLVAGTGSDDNSEFAVDGSQIKTSGEFNFETKSSYAVRIRTSDGNGGTFDKQLTISINDVNDTPTNININNAAIAEEQPAGTTVGLLTTVDEDDEVPPSDTHSYAIVDGDGDDDNPMFSIDGNLLKTTAPLDFDSQEDYKVLIKTDDGNGGMFTKGFVITATDVNDPPTNIGVGPCFNSPCNVGETTGVQTVSFLNTIDEDKFDTHTYFLINNGGGNFILDGEGNATLKSTTALSSGTSYTIEVESTDSDGLKFSKTIELNVVNIAGNKPPANIDLSPKLISEQQPIGTLVGTLTTEDQDEDDNHIYSLVSGSGDTHNSDFEIPTSPGNTIVSKSVFNFAEQSQYSIRVKTDDGNGGVLEKKFVINVLELPDVEFESATIAPDPVAAGGVLSVSGSIRNNNSTDVDANKVSLKIYFSPNETFDSSDPDLSLLKSEELLSNDFPANQARAFEVTDLQIADDLGNGRYYLHLILDESNTLAEANENNNTVGVAFDVRREDLLIESVEFSKNSVTAGKPISVTVKVRNGGLRGIGAGQATLSAYISKSDVFSSSDPDLISLRSETSLQDDFPALTTKEAAITDLVIPANLSQGTYFIHLLVDESDGIMEGDETNNVLSKAVEVVLPDLFVQSAAPSQNSITAGLKLSLTGTIGNNGSSDLAAESVKLKLYLSSNPVFDPNGTEQLALTDDVVLGEDIAGGGTQTFKVDDILIPIGYNSGSNHLHVVIDNNNEIREGDENNNTLAIPIEILSDVQKPEITASADNADEVAMDQGQVIVKYVVTDNVGVDKVMLFLKGISDEIDGVESALPTHHDQANSEFSFEVSLTKFDEIGLEYWVVATDVSGNEETSPTAVMYKSFTETNSPVLQNLKSGGTVSSYQIISIPYQLENNRATSIFDEFGGYNDEIWRLLHWDPTSNRYLEPPTDLERIEQGKGYWLNIKNPANDLNVGQGSTPRVTGSNPFVITIVQGHNQIGNPYDFAIDWNDVIEHNNNPSGLGSLRTYENSSFINTTFLDAFRGGFVHWDNPDPLSLAIPVKRMPTGGRKWSNESPIADLDVDSWQIDLHLYSSSYQYKLAGFGMDNDARPGKDDFDEIAPPKFLGLPEITFPHPEFFSPRFTRDITRTAQSNIWEFVVSTEGDERATLKWDRSRITTTEKELFLLDVQNEKVVNMTRNDRYVFNTSSSHDFKVFFGSKEFIDEELQPEEVVFGNPFPNPISESTTFSFGIRKTAKISLVVFDLLGNEVERVIDKESFDAGFHDKKWTIGNTTSIQPGVYLTQLIVDGWDRVITQKIIIK